jgi:hypothetical protein
MTCPQALRDLAAVLPLANEDDIRLAMTYLRECASRIDAKDDALHKISKWAKAYPLEVFPEPDWKRAAEVLKAAGMSLDCISAANMRHVITQVQNIVDAAMKEQKG